MKIELNLAPEKIIIISAAVQPIYSTKAHTRREKSTLTISFDVAAKLDSKVASMKAKMSSLFDSKKKIKVSLKYHEADMLELLLIDQIRYAETDYIRQQIQSVINVLNQKLT